MDSNAIASIITATISGILVAIPTIFATVSANKASSAVMEERMKNMGDQIKNMSDKIEKLNDFNERLIVVEQAVKSAHKRIDVITIDERRETK